jgi:U3 small nucleolar RNA-associated protein 14
VKKQLRGWGDWAGPDIKPRLTPEQERASKMKAIEELRRRRKDGDNRKVIID